MAATGSQVTQFSTHPMSEQYAYGLAQTMSNPVATFLAPNVDVETVRGYFKKYDRKHAFYLPETLRPIGGRATEITWGAEDGTYSCEPHAIDVPLDKLVQGEMAKLGDPMKQAAGLATEVAALQHEVRVIDLALATVASSATVKPYKTTSPDDPIAAIDQYLKQVLLGTRWGSAIGLRVLFGASAWLNIKNCAAVRNRVITAGAGGAVAAGTPAQAANNVRVESMSSLLFGEPECKLSLMVKDTAPAGVTDSPAFVLDDDVLIFAARQTPNLLDPSFMKTFRLRGQWMVPRQYQRDDGRVDVAGFDWTSDVKVTNSAAAIRITISTATS